MKIGKRRTKQLDMNGDFGSTRGVVWTFYDRYASAVSGGARHLRAATGWQWLGWNFHGRVYRAGKAREILPRSRVAPPARASVCTPRSPATHASPPCLCLTQQQHATFRSPSRSRAEPVTSAVLVPRVPPAEPIEICEKRSLCCAGQRHGVRRAYAQNEIIRWVWMAIYFYTALSTLPLPQQVLNSI